MKRTRLKLEDGTVVQPVIEGRIREALVSLDPSNTFAILERDDGAFMQTSGSLNDGFYLEYRLKQTEAHYAAAAEALPAEKIEEVMLRFARYEAGWRNALDWRVVAEAAPRLAASTWPLAGVLAWLVCAGGLVIWAHVADDASQVLPYFVGLGGVAVLWFMIDAARERAWWRLAFLVLQTGGVAAFIVESGSAGMVLLGLGYGAEAIGATKTGKILSQGDVHEKEHPALFGLMLFFYAAAGVTVTLFGLWHLVFP